MSFSARVGTDKVAAMPACERISYSLPQFATSSIGMLLTIHATVYYEYLGANLAYIALFTAVSRSCDVISDPLMGWVTDSTRSRFGRRIPYILVGMWFYGLAVTLVLGAGVFLPADVIQSNGGNCSITDSLQPTPEQLAEKRENSLKVSYYFGVTFVFFYLCDTFVNIPYNALGPEIAPDYDNRSRLYFTQSIIGFLGTLFGASAPIAATAFGLSKEQGFAVVGLTFGIYYIVSQINLAINCKEKCKREDLNEALAIVPGVNRAFRNPAFRILVVSWLVDAIGWFAVSAMLPFFLIYVVRPGQSPEWGSLSNDTWLGIAFFVFFSAAIVGTPFWKLVERKFGMYRAWLAYNLAMGLTNLGFLFVGEFDIVQGLIVTFLNGIPVGGKFLSDATLASCLSVDEFYTGERREATFTMFASFVPKVVSIPANALPLAVIASAGFIASSLECVNGTFQVVPQVQPRAVQALVRTFFIGLPVVTNLMSFYIKRKFPLKTAEDHHKIAIGIELHKKGLAAFDPISKMMVKSHVDHAMEECKNAVLLDHFNRKEQFELISRNGLAHKLVYRNAAFLFISIISAIVNVYIVYTTFPLLENVKFSWIPSFCQILIGVSVMCVFFYSVKLHAARTLLRNPLPVSFIVHWCRTSFPSGEGDNRVLRALAKSPKIGTELTNSVGSGDANDSDGDLDSIAPSVVP